MAFVNTYQFVCVSFCFEFLGGVWGLILLVPHHCFSSLVLIMEVNVRIVDSFARSGISLIVYIFCIVHTPFQEE